MKEYNLTYLEALKIVMEGGAVKGDNFKKGVFLTMNTNGWLVIKDANQYYSAIDFKNFGSLEGQKFRELTIMTKKELER